MITIGLTIHLDKFHPKSIKMKLNDFLVKVMLNISHSVKIKKGIGITFSLKFLKRKRSLINMEIKFQRVFGEYFTI